MIRKLVLGLVVLALLLAVVVGLLTWQFSGLVTPRIESYLTSYGVQSLSTSEVKWRFNRLRIQDIHARGAIDGTPFELHLERMDMGYQWWRLFNGTLDSIAIGSVRIDLDLAAAQDDAAASDTGLAIPPLLPQAWLGALPVARLTVDELAGTLHLSDDRVLNVAGRDWRLGDRELDATLTLREQEAGEAPVAHMALLLLNIASRPDQPLEVSVGISGGGRLVANLALSLTTDSQWQGLEFALRGDVNHRNLHRALQSLPVAGYPLLGDENVLDALPALTGDSRVRLVLRLPAVVKGEIADWLLDGALEGSVRHRLAWQGWPDPAVGATRAQLRYGLTGSPRAFDVVLHRPVTVEGELLELGDALPEFFADWRREVPFRLEVNTDQPLSVRGGELSLATADAQLTLGPDGQHVATQARITGLVMDGEGIAGTVGLDLRLHNRGQPLLVAKVDGKVRQADGAWRLSGDLNADSLALSGQWQASLRDDGGYRISLDSRTTNLPKVLEIGGTLLPLDLPLALTAGSGRLHYQLNYQLTDALATEEAVEVEGAKAPAPGLVAQPASQRITLNLSGLTGLLQGVAVNGVAVDAIIEESDGWRSVGDIEARVAQLSAGVAVDDITVLLRLLPSPSLEQTHWAVDRFEARLFGGTAALAAPFEVALPVDDATSFNLVLSDWQLGDIFALYADHGLSGSGVMSGNLPVRLAAEGVSIEGGELAGQQPGGTIVYDGGEAGDAVAGGNQQLNVALRLLNNFQYDTLVVRTDFAPDGELMLGLQLAGRNPDEFDGQAVNFNINVEENLFDLLRALRLSDDVIKRLEDRLGR